MCSILHRMTSVAQIHVFIAVQPVYIFIYIGHFIRFERQGVLSHYIIFVFLYLHE